MFTIEVIPVQRGVFSASLTFFSRTYISPGSVVSAPIRNKMVPAVVLKSTDVRTGKLELKSSGFALKKLGTAEPKILYADACIQAAQKSAAYYGIPVGSVLREVSFSAILNSPRGQKDASHKAAERTALKPEVLILQAEPHERIHAYRNLVRETFARSKSVLIVAPTLIEVEQLQIELGRGIEDHVVVLTSALTTKELRKAWSRATDHTSPVLILGTPPALSVPRADIDAIILERESARAYRSRGRGQLDFRKVAEYVAEHAGARCILADFPVRVETRYRTDIGTAEDMTRPQARTQGHTVVTVQDVRKKDTMLHERRSFSTLSDESFEAIESTLHTGGRVVVYAARKGIAPLTVCNDCGTPITDPATGAPMVLHKTPKGNVFMSHRSGALLPAERRCAVCGGWNLVTLGIGAERVYDDLQKRFPKAPLQIVTTDTATTHKAAQKIQRSFYDTPGSILVGTERMLPYLTEHVPLVVVASIDSVLASSAWRAHEQALSTLCTLTERAELELRIETRRPETAVIQTIQSGNVLDFYRDEIQDRATYGYPPCATFIGLSWSGTEQKCATLRAVVMSTVTGEDVVGPLPPELIDKNKFMERAVIRVKEGRWPDRALIEKLETLPPDIHRIVDPDEIV